MQIFLHYWPVCRAGMVARVPGWPVAHGLTPGMVARVPGWRWAACMCGLHATCCGLPVWPGRGGQRVRRGTRRTVKRYSPAWDSRRRGRRAAMAQNFWGQAYPTWFFHATSQTVAPGQHRISPKFLFSGQSGACSFCRFSALFFPIAFFSDFFSISLFFLMVKLQKLQVEKKERG